MKALTVQQPWAWSIAFAGKTVENRTQAWKYRGPLAIHAGNRWSDRGAAHPAYLPALDAAPAFVRDRAAGKGAIIALAELVDVHPSQPDAACCAGSPWAEDSYDERLPDGHFRRRRDIVHLVLEDVRPLPTPVATTGRLGLWRPDTDVQAAVRDQLTPSYAERLREARRDAMTLWEDGVDVDYELAVVDRLLKDHELMRRWREGDHLS